MTDKRKPFYWYKPKRKNKKVHRMIVQKMRDKQKAELKDMGSSPDFDRIMQRCRAYKGPPPWD